MMGEPINDELEKFVRKRPWLDPDTISASA
jgi:hypothetical protein